MLFSLLISISKTLEPSVLGSSISASAKELIGNKSPKQNKITTKVFS